LLLAKRLGVASLLSDLEVAVAVEVVAVAVAVILPVLSALLNVDITVSPLPTLTWLSGRATTLIVLTTRVSTTLNLIDWRLTL